MLWLITLAALDGKETVAWVLVDREAARKVGSFWALVLAEVVDGLFFAAAERDLL